MLSLATSLPRVAGARSTARLTDACDWRSCDERDARFVRLLHDYRAYGGLARQAEIEARQARVGVPDVLRSRHLLRIRWSGIGWLPLFQFEPSMLALRAACEIVVVELEGVYDDWRLAEWFVQPNEWLEGAMPVEHIDDEAALREAARTDRFIAIG